MPNHKSFSRRSSSTEPALRYLRRRGFTGAPVALILGSGFGGMEGQCKADARINYADIPRWPRPSGLPGHACRLTQGRLWGRDVLVFRGRYHAYEGFAARELALIPQLAHALGAETLIVTNAAGGIRADLKPGSLMAITDHINQMGINPLVGPQRLPGAARFAPLAGAYDPALARALVKAGKAAGESVATGVYAAVLGPSFETAAEVRALKTLGADAVGMSTVPEVIVARALGLRVCGLSLITNRAGSTDDSHEGTLKQGTDNAPRLAAVLRELLGLPGT
ncbi:MAG: purine-nucleoside phosphorylase [Planctomycetes bacterium]|jgi:inosine/guanosine/xanthosine phosphorylase family protein|nr:purine-nucleoside phosphorylase [Planctomycetota bacterium]MCL4731145.1 purine-nucleoside phosphorylase [Planctomycetota bacterium]